MVIRFTPCHLAFTFRSLTSSRILAIRPESWRYFGDGRQVDLFARRRDVGRSCGFVRDWTRRRPAARVKSVTRAWTSTDRVTPSGTRLRCRFRQRTLVRAIIQIEMAVNSGKRVDDPQRRPNLAPVRVLHPLRADEPLDIPTCYMRRAITHTSKMRPAIAVFERVFQQPKSRADGDTVGAVRFPHLACFFAEQLQAVDEERFPKLRKGARCRDRAPASDGYRAD